MTALRESIARALYCNIAQDSDRPDWEDLPPPRREGWLSDADEILPIVRDAAAAIASGYAIDSALGLTDWGVGHNAACKQIAAAITQRMSPPEKWECPVEMDGCAEDCGAYGCGN